LCSAIDTILFLNALSHYQAKQQQQQKPNGLDKRIFLPAKRPHSAHQAL
jgi:hypothetical protein